ncbi:hypothetical protein [Lelliottia sp. JS-SCA-14]|uniref:hypothetical protein n=1 Tax=Lelliottia sp. JS-SCA-14 TaxID=3110110 RepID=UPI002D792DEF|nr:hypothetical protein [Lelliottia sp. JS-SCA-14]
MEFKPNTLLPQDSGMYDQNLSSKLESLVIPQNIFLKSSSDFDDKHIHNEGDKWVFYYSGSKRYVYFKLDELTNTLLKYFCFKYASTMFPTFLPVLSHQWTQAFSYCRENGGFTLLILRQYIESDDLDVRAFYSILFGLKILCSEEFPGFTLEDYEDLEFIPRPNAYNWDIYQDIDNILEPFEKSMISKGLFEMATALVRGKSYNIRDLKYASVLGLSYVTGARPVQLAKLAVRDLRIDTTNTDSGLIRYSILLPKAISDITEDFIELDDVVAHIVQPSSELRGRAGLRDKVSKALAKRDCRPTRITPSTGKGKIIHYSKSDLSCYLKKEFDGNDANTPCTHSWVDNGKRYETKYEDLLFLYPKGSLTLKRRMTLKTIPLPLSNDGMNRFLGNFEGYVSIFDKYNLLEDDGRPTQLRTHIPRHNINTFLAIADISEHLQAMLMGRVDIAQNKHYQHLALKERRKAASLVPLVPIVQEQVISTAVGAVTPLDAVKQNGMMVFSSTQNLETNIKANLHTFDNRDDVAGFIEASLGDGLFEDIAAAFEEISKNEGPSQASEMVKRHAVLHPLKLGSCMRDINLWGCPYRMKCQALKSCEHFTLTGRIDEYSAVVAKGRALNEATLAFEQYTAALPDNQLMQGNIQENLAQLDALTKELRRRSNSLQVIPSHVVLSGEMKVEGEIRTLAQLFALENQKIKQGED